MRPGRPLIADLHSTGTSRAGSEIIPPDEGSIWEGNYLTSAVNAAAGKSNGMSRVEWNT